MRYPYKLAVSFACLMLPIVVLTPGCGGGAEDSLNMVTIKGSDTMVHLAMQLAEEYMLEHPEVEVSVTGGGSGTGIASLLNGSTDLCTSSRDLQAEEQELAEKQGMTIEEYAIALDGIGVIVHPENPVKALTLDELKKIFTGVYTRWSEVGGPDEPILLLSRESSSGTYIFFQEHVLDKQNFSQQARLMTASSTIVESVAADAWSIGYVGLGYAEGAGERVALLGIKSDAESAPVLPMSDTVLSGAYPLSRPLHIYTTAGAGPASHAFIEFALGTAGQEIVKDAGYVPVS